MAEKRWPALPLVEWQATYATLHMWTQIVGKVTLELTPRVNHWWNVAFAVTPRGLTTPTLHAGDRAFRVEFDFNKHQLLISCDGGVTGGMLLAPCSVAQFYRKFMSTLAELGIEVKIRTQPCEVEHPVRFENDFRHNAYDEEYANRLWRILLQTDQVFSQFRAGFLGKCSPVHFFWGSFDLAVTRFSGRRAPERAGADMITREAYSHEVISHGFWPGLLGEGAAGGDSSGRSLDAPAFYSYAAPEPAGFKEARILPPQAFYSDQLKEWILFYDDLRASQSPERTLMDFLQSTYESGANLAGWDRAALERG